MNNKKNTKQSGFTLIELLISMTIFTFIMVAAVGSIYTSNAAAKRAQAIGVVLSNLDFAVESISRNIRTGQDYYCSVYRTDTPARNDCPGSDIGITIHSNLGGNKLIYYYYDLSTFSIKKETNNALPDGTFVSSGWSNSVSVTSPEVKVQSAFFQVVGSDSTDLFQPRVFIDIVGTAQTDKESVPFNIQTLISQRNIE